jgi:hypothetical protein
MVVLEQALDDMFKYHRRATESSRSWALSGYTVQPTEFLNVKVRDKYFGIEGTIPLMGVFNNKRGHELAYYTGEPDLTYEGEFLPAPFNAFKDCSKMHVGLILNCLAYMAPTRFDRLTVITMDQKMINVDFKPAIAEQFLMYISGKKVKKEETKALTKKKGKGPFVDPGQAKLF